MFCMRMRGMHTVVDHCDTPTASAVAGRGMHLNGRHVMRLHDASRSNCSLLLMRASGANMGGFSMFFAAATGPTGAVYSFEPQARMYQLLCTNMIIK